MRIFFLHKCRCLCIYKQVWGVDPVLVAKSFSHVARLWYSRAIYEDWYSKQICSVICKQICVGVFKQIYLDMIDKYMIQPVVQYEDWYKSTSKYVLVYLRHVQIYLTNICIEYLGFVCLSSSVFDLCPPKILCGTPKNMD